STLWAVELRREKSRGRPQDRVRPAQLTHFLLQFDQALGLASRGSGTVSLVDLGLHDPVPQSLGIDPELLAHPTERARPSRWIPSRLNSHPRGSFPKLVRVLPRCCHVPHPPVDSEPPPDPGRFTLRVLLASRSLTDQQRTANKNALTALLRITDVGIDARKPLTDAQIATIAAWRTGRDERSQRVFREEGRRLAKSIIEQTRSLQQNHQALSVLTETLAPGLQSIPGVGAVTGAILVASYSHHGRVRSEAAFAALGGIAPLPASSGNTRRHRLSRSGDRQLNRPVDVVVRTRMSYDPATCKYVDRRRAEGLSKR